MNGRALGDSQLGGFRQLYGVVPGPGRYRLDHQGTYGIEGCAQPLGNLLVILARRGAGGGASRDNIWSSRVGAGNHDPASGAGFVSVPGHGPIGFGM